MFFVDSPIFQQLIWKPEVIAPAAAGLFIEVYWVISAIPWLGGTVQTIGGTVQEVSPTVQEVVWMV